MIQGTKCGLSYGLPAPSLGYAAVGAQLSCINTESCSMKPFYFVFCIALGGTSLFIYFATGDEYAATFECNGDAAAVRVEER